MQDFIFTLFLIGIIVWIVVSFARRGGISITPSQNSRRRSRSGSDDGDSCCDHHSGDDD